MKNFKKLDENQLANLSGEGCAYAGAASAVVATAGALTFFTGGISLIIGGVAGAAAYVACNW